MSAALVFITTNDAIVHCVLGSCDSTPTPMCTTNALGCGNWPNVMCGRMRNYVKQPKRQSSDNVIYAPVQIIDMKFCRERVNIPSWYTEPNRYIEYHSNIYAMCISLTGISLVHLSGSIPARIEPSIYHHDSIVESDDGKLYFAMSGVGTEDQPVRDVDGWQVINMAPRDHLCATRSQGVNNSLRFCVGGANNLYKCAMVYHGGYMNPQLTMRDPRCEYATFTGHSMVDSMSNIDGLLICDQDGMITIYDERANAMIGTPFTSDGYMGACRTR